jgi:hypothetical protein
MLNHVILKNPYLNPFSLPSLMRRARFKVINRMISKILARQGTCRILDIGGTAYYWQLNKGFLEANKGKIKILLVNLPDAKGANAPGEVNGDPLFENVSGDACDMATYFLRDDYDMIHSNSVIEHVGGESAQRAMAEHTALSKKPYYLQTPNYWFPIEPHYRALAFHWLDVNLRAALLQRFTLGFRTRTPNREEALGIIESVRLLTPGQLRNLFPGGKLLRERFLGFTKSLIAIGNIELA